MYNIMYTKAVAFHTIHVAVCSFIPTVMFVVFSFS